MLALPVCPPVLSSRFRHVDRSSSLFTRQPATTPDAVPSPDQMTSLPTKLDAERSPRSPSGEQEAPLASLRRSTPPSRLREGAAGSRNGRAKEAAHLV